MYISPKLLAAALALTCTCAHADTWITGSVASYHFKRDAGMNEQNFGLGIEHEVSENTRLVAGFYKNSLRKESLYAGAAWAPFVAGPLRLGVVAGVVTGYVMSPAPMLAPVLMIEGQRFGVNLLLIPPVGDKVVGALALQVKVRF